MKDKIYTFELPENFKPTTRLNIYLEVEDKEKIVKYKKKLLSEGCVKRKATETSIARRMIRKCINEIEEGTLTLSELINIKYE